MHVFRLFNHNHQQENKKKANKDHFSPELLGHTLLYNSIFKSSVGYLHILHGAVQ